MSHIEDIHFYITSMINAEYEAYLKRTDHLRKMLDEITSTQVKLAEVKPQTFTVTKEEYDDQF